MSVVDCLEDALRADRDLDPVRLRAAQETYRKIEQKYLAEGMDAAEAQTRAAEAMRTEQMKAVAERRAREMKQAVINMQVQRIIATHRNERGDLDPAGALAQLVETLHTSARFDNIASTREALEERYTATMHRALAAHGRNVFGSVRRKALMEDWIRELHGQSSGNPAAAEIAEGIRLALDTARRDFNIAGGHIGFLRDYDVPHSHNRDKVSAAGAEAWINRLMSDGVLDWSRIENPLTGKPFQEEGTALDSAAAHEFLAEIHEAIRTDNWSRQEASSQPRHRALANRRAAARRLHFASADAWLQYNREFGDTDPFSAVILAVQGLARDTAMMRILGPNPKSGLELAIQTAEKTVKSARYATEKARKRAENRIGIQAGLSRSGSVPTLGVGGRARSPRRSAARGRA